MGLKACRNLLQEWQVEESEYMSLQVDDLRAYVLRTGCTQGRFLDGPNVNTCPTTAGDINLSPETMTALAAQVAALIRAELVAETTSKVLEQVQPKLDKVDQLEQELASQKAICASLATDLARVSKQVTLLGSHADSHERMERSAKARLTSFPAQDGETPATLLARVQTELVQGQMKVAGVRVISATRQEPRAQRSYAAAAAGERQAPADRHPAVLLEFASPADRLQVLKARRLLAGTKYGLEEDMTPWQLAQKRAAWSTFKNAKTAGKKAYWRAEKLFINGVEYHP